MTAPIGSWVSSAASDIGKVRQVNEDAYLERPDLGVWAVADGMGGHYGGAEASRLVVRLLGEIGLPATLSGLIDAIDAGLKRVNQELLASGAAAHRITGSTVVVLAARGTHGACVWAGDSRAYRLRDGTLTQLTTDHSQAEVYVRLGLLSRAEAAHHPFSNVVTRAIGTQEDLALDTAMLDLKAGDRYLLCSDGLYRHLDDEELTRELGTGTVSSVAQRLIDLTLERGALDNVTVVVAEWQVAAGADEPQDTLEVTEPNLHPGSPRGAHGAGRLPSRKAWR